MKKNLLPGIAGCLMLALVLAGCGQGGWKDAGTPCTGTERDTKKTDLTGVAKIYQAFCGKNRIASDLRCKDKRLEVQCK